MNTRSIVFLAVNASYSHSNLAGWYLREIAEAAGWQWTDIAFLARDAPHPAVEKAVRVNPRILAATFYLFNRQAVLQFLRRFKTLCPSCIVIAGGPEFLGDNRQFLLTEREVDLVVRGEGERPFGEFLKSVEHPERWRSIPGLSGVLDGEVFDGGPAPAVEDLDSIPSPYARHVAGFAMPFVQLETSRGCSNRCAFCTSGRPGGVRRFSLGRVQADLDVIRRMNVRCVRLADRTFNEVPSRCISLIRLFRDEYPELRFHLEIDPARLTRSILAELAATAPGRFHIEVGVQSLSPQVYRNMGRQATVRRSYEGLRALCGMGNVDVHTDLIAGLPGATLAGLLEDIRALVALRPQEIQLELLKVLPGTRIEQEREQWQIVSSPEPPYQVLGTRDMNGADLAAACDYSRLLDLFYNAASLQAVIGEAGALDPDFWPALREFCASRFDLAVTPPLDVRFRVLDAFLPTRPAAGVGHRLHYAWMKWGLGTRSGICAATPRRGPIPPNAILVEGAAEGPFSRQYLVELDCPHLFAYGGTRGDRRATAVFRLD